MATNDVWRLSLLGSHSGTEIAVVTMHIKFLTANATFDGAAAYITTNLVTLVKASQANTFRWDKINGLTVNTTPKVSGEYSTGYPLAGAVGSDELPHQVACVVTHKTQYAGRSYRGRHYLPAITEFSQAAGGFDSTLVNALQQYYDDLVAALGLGGSNADYQWVVWSDKLNTATPVTQAIVRSNPGVIRRRRIGVGQ